MQKLLSILLMVIFCTVQAAWAGNTIIIGSDGQAKWEDVTNNEIITPEIIQNTDKKKIIHELTISDSVNQDKIYVNYKGDVVKIEETKAPDYIDNIIDRKTETKYKNMVSYAPKEITNFNEILYNNGYYKYDISQSKNEYIKYNLLDGDYIKIHKAGKYFAEYHKNKELMGLVKMEEYIRNDNENFVGFYEYRLGYNSENGMGLKHVMFYNLKKDAGFSQYIFNADGELLCGQKNNNIYIREDARNMLPKFTDKATMKKISSNKTADMRKFRKKMLKKYELPLAIISLPVMIPYGLLFSAYIVFTSPFHMIYVLNSL